MDKDQIIYNLEHKISDLQDKIDKLEDENNKLRSKLDSANFTIRTELEPRIKAEKRSYDRWVLNPER